MRSVPRRTALFARPARHDGTNTYVYDVENRLVSRSGGASATLRYDPLGRLYEVAGASGTRRFLYDGSDLIAEYNTSGTLLRRYVHGLGAGDDPQVWFEGSGVSDAARRYLYADERGSIVAVTNSTGSVLTVNTYDEYGIPGSGNAGAFQYTGQVWLPELGMYHYKARMYSPTLGRFMQTDPIGYGDGMNMYAYVGGDPVNGVDPTGMICWDIGFNAYDLQFAKEACTSLGYHWSDGMKWCGNTAQPDYGICVTHDRPPQNPGFGSMEEFCRYNPSQLGCGGSTPPPGGGTPGVNGGTGSLPQNGVSTDPAPADARCVHQGESGRCIIRESNGRTYYDEQYKLDQCKAHSDATRTAGQGGLLSTLLSLIPGWAVGGAAAGGILGTLSLTSPPPWCEVGVAQ